MGFGFDGYRGPDRIAVAFPPTQVESDRIAKILHRVAQNPELWRVSVFQDDFQSPVLVQVGECKRATVVKKIQSNCARDFRERAVVIIRVENIPLTTTPGVVRPDQLIDGVPSLLVLQQRSCILGGFRHQLSPEEARKVALLTPWGLGP